MPPVAAILTAIGTAVGASGAAATAIGAATVLGTGAAIGSSISSANKATKQAQNAANDQLAASNAQQKSLESMLYKNQNDSSQATADATQKAAKDRQKQLAAAATGRNSTILTSPLGVSGTAPGAEKTLLGA